MEQPRLAIARTGLPLLGFGMVGWKVDAIAAYQEIASSFLGGLSPQFQPLEHVEV
jgi:hypothetical protein